MKERVYFVKGLAYGYGIGFTKRTIFVWNLWDKAVKKLVFNIDGSLKSGNYSDYGDNLNMFLKWAFPLALKARGMYYGKV